MPTPSPKLQSTGSKTESGSMVDWRQPGEELWKWKWRRWTTAGAPSRGWPVTDRGGGASLLPYTPAGMTGIKKVSHLTNPCEASKQAGKLCPRWLCRRQMKADQKGTELAGQTNPLFQVVFNMTTRFKGAKYVYLEDALIMTPLFSCFCSKYWLNILTVFTSSWGDPMQLAGHSNPRTN